MKPLGCIFVGPSLPHASIESIDRLTLLPPAQQGDVYRAARTGYSVIGIVDGYFGSVPAVWHREITWALSHGIRVLGASSMGALRAAELADVGMEGVGAIFAAYRNGELEDDDEVTIVHSAEIRGQPERSFVPLTEAMVNIRATVAEAVQSEIITAGIADRIVARAKSTFYKERTYAKVLAQLKGDAPRDIRVFEEWIEDHAVDVKREDAQALVAKVQAALTSPTEPTGEDRTPLHFEYPSKWAALVEQFGTRADMRDDTAAPMSNTSGLIEELKLQSGLFERVWSQAVLRALAQDEAGRAGFEPDVTAQQRAERDIWKRNGISTNQHRETWLDNNELGLQDFPSLRRNHAQVRWLSRKVAGITAALIPDQLRVMGLYAELAQRASMKKHMLGSYRSEQLDTRSTGLGEQALLHWFFREVLAVPPSPNPNEAGQQLGFGSYTEFLGAVIREYHFRRATTSQADTAPDS